MEDKNTPLVVFFDMAWLVVVILVLVGVLGMLHTYLSLNKHTQKNLQDWAKRKNGHYYWPIGFWGMLIPFKSLWDLMVPAWSLERIPGISLSEQSSSYPGCLELSIQERQVLILQTSLGKHHPLFWYAKVSLGTPPIKRFLISPHHSPAIGIGRYYFQDWDTITTDEAAFNDKIRVQGKPGYEVKAYLTAKRRAVILELVAQYPSFYIDRGYACIQAHSNSEGDPVERLLTGIQDICLNYPSIFVT